MATTMTTSPFSKVMSIFLEEGNSSQESLVSVEEVEVLYESLLPLRHASSLCGKSQQSLFSVTNRLLNTCPRNVNPLITNYAHVPGMTDQWDIRQQQHHSRSLTGEIV